MQTGYNPRVLLFSTAPDAFSDKPLSILNDHTYGVASLALSEDSRWLCTLGNSYDGFVFVYYINLNTGIAKLHSSNKCSNVSSVIWMGSNVISIGIRHVKLWRLEKPTSKLPPQAGSPLNSGTPQTPGNPKPRILSGRNCILGQTKDATFTTAASISNCTAVVCSAQGDVCLLDDTERNQRFVKVTKMDVAISSVVFDQKHNLIWFAGENGLFKSMLSHDIVRQSAPEIKHSASIADLAVLGSGCIRSSSLALGIVRDSILSLDHKRIIEIFAIEEKGLRAKTLTLTKTLPAHESATLGVCNLLPKSQEHEPDFLTYSAKGTVLFWRFDGTCTDRVVIPLDESNTYDESTPNEIKVLTPTESYEFLVSGDKNGTLRLVLLDSAIFALSGVATDHATGSLTVHRQCISKCKRTKAIRMG